MSTASSVATMSAISVALFAPGKPAQRGNLTHGFGHRLRRIASPDLARRDVAHESTSRSKLGPWPYGQMIGQADAATHGDTVAHYHGTGDTRKPGYNAI